METSIGLIDVSKRQAGLFIHSEVSVLSVQMGDDALS